MDTSDPEIEFFSDGTCSHCRRYFARVERDIFSGSAGEQKLRSLVDRVKEAGRGNEYDCIIGVSGGVDSTTVAYHVKRLGLRPLAVHLDNGWDSELAVDNITRTLKNLDIELFTHVIDWDEFRDLQLSFLRASVPNCEIPTDHAINAILVRTAQERGIKYLLVGSNVRTEAILPPAWGHVNLDLRHIKAIQRRFGNRKLVTFPQLSLARFVTAVMVQGVRYVPILNYLDYDKAKAKQLLMDELGWRDYGGKHYESIYTRFFQAYILPRKFGFDKRRAHLACLVCGGELSRDSALLELETEPAPEALLESDRQFVIKKLGLTGAGFDEIMAAPVKRHIDYPSNHRVFYGLKSLREVFRLVATRG